MLRRPILFITCMITDRIGFHSVLLPLLILKIIYSCILTFDVKFLDCAFLLQHFDNWLEKLYQILEKVFHHNIQHFKNWKLVKTKTFSTLSPFH